MFFQEAVVVQEVVLVVEVEVVAKVTDLYVVAVVTNTYVATGGRQLGRTLAMNAALGGYLGLKVLVLMTN